MRKVVFGPPGCGKTRTGQRLVEEFLRSGSAVDQIAYVAFAKSAAMEAAQRCGITEEEYRHLWFRTLHSTGYRLMGEGRAPVMTAKHRKQFAEEFGVDLGPEDREAKSEEESVEDLYFQLYRSTDAIQHEGDNYLRVYNLSRLQCRNLDELEQIDQNQHPHTLALKAIEPRAYRDFVGRYKRFKEREGVIDFVDMLSSVLKYGVTPLPWELAVIDESQDLTPLMWAVAERLFFGAKSLWLIGDDDQCVFSWMGARADDFLSYRRPGEVMILQQTHRFGQGVVDFARRIVQRLSHRQDKEVIGKEGAVNRISTEFEFDPSVFSSMANGSVAGVLHRHVAGCRALGMRFLQAGIPYWNERGTNPLGRTIERNGYLAFLNLLKNRGLRHEELMYLLKVVPSRKVVDKKETISLVRHGAKKRILEVTGDQVGQRYTVESLDEVFTPVFMNAVRNGDAGWLNVEFRDYYEQLVQKGFDLVHGRPNTIITTIHGSKGRQFKNVALFTEVFPKVLHSEDEHRVSYVGATRTEGDLWVVRERVAGDWTREYPYPV